MTAPDKPASEGKCGCHFWTAERDCPIHAPTPGATLTREEFESALRRYPDDTPCSPVATQCEDKLLAHDAALRARLAEAETSNAGLRAAQKIDRAQLNELLPQVDALTLICNGETARADKLQEEVNALRKELGR